MSSMRVLPAFQFIVAKSLAASFDTKVAAPPQIPKGPTNIQFMHNVCIELAWTGNPVGVFKVLGSVSGQNWVDIGLAVNNPAGVAGSALLDLNQLSFPMIALQYIATSGAGSLNAYIGGKAFT